MVVTDKFRHKAYLDSEALLQEQFWLNQIVWDSTNSVVVRFAGRREEMKSYFMNLGLGCYGIDLLKTAVCDWLKLNLRKSFIEELVFTVGLRLKTQQWFRGAEVMQAKIDHSLVNLIAKNKIDIALLKIREPLIHIREIVSEIVQKEVRHCFGSVHKAYQRAITDCIETSALHAAEQVQDRAVFFMLWLEFELQHRLLSGEVNWLLKNMPRANVSCDGQPPDIFLARDKHYVCAPMLAIDDKAMDQVENQAESDIVNDVLEFLESPVGGEGSLRCGEPCPVCSCPCTREYDHTTSNDNNCHDTNHQPAGLAGIRDATTEELAPGSCFTNAVNGITFQRNKGEQIQSFAKFYRVFPSWSKPVKKSTLQLREYIFLKYQNELVAATPGAKKCSKIPLGYNHNLTDIKESIAQLVSRR